ncbi:MAG: DNA cytosine methyltransferase [Syntrophomonadaceae bacterium]
MIAVDLFCGAGGLSEGLTQAGFDIRFASDIHPVYSETYKYNHPDTYVYTEDIRELSMKDLLKLSGVVPGELDLLAGGPPCQGFSINAPVRSMDDQRNNLFRDFLRAVEALQPKFVLIENVPGIVSLDKGLVTRAIYEALQELGYRVKHMILFSAHYGIPQMRWRTFFMATRVNCAQCVFPIPSHHATGVANFTGGKELTFTTSQGILFGNQLKKHTSVWEAISDLPVLQNGGGSEVMEYSQDSQTDYQSEIRRNSDKLFNHLSAKLHGINLDRLQYIPQGGSWRDIPFDLLPEGLKRARRSDHTKRYGRLDPDGLCSTIMTKCDPHWGSFFHPTQDRILSVREAARIQSFPDYYRILGNITEQYEQVGNAVPPMLARAIGWEISYQIEQSEHMSEVC